ncbi:hypothetical protein HGM15179_010450 [Zosterops borbonicus]|uniref:Uncharacterized protein n=1 Tax=Zosterops borbonicus TaxID=364589 RepID=A0A8K1GE01_9PASS|nr:hypothetical protein HGM15179_010450 [Zosterops borbonicus]
MPRAEPSRAQSSLSISRARLEGGTDSDKWQQPACGYLFLGQDYSSHLRAKVAILAKEDIPGDWTVVNVTLIYTKTWKEDLGNYRSVILTYLSAGKSHGSSGDHLECHHRAHKIHHGIRPS